MDWIRERANNAPQLFSLIGVVLCMAYAMYCFGIVVWMRGWGHHTVAELQRIQSTSRYRSAGGGRSAYKIYEMQYSVDGHEHVVRIKQKIGGIDLGAAGFRRRMNQGVTVHYSPRKPQKGYYLRSYLVNALNAMVFGAILLFLFLL